MRLERLKGLKSEIFSFRPLYHPTIAQFQFWNAVCQNSWIDFQEFFAMDMLTKKWMGNQNQFFYHRSIVPNSIPELNFRPSLEHLILTYSLTLFLPTPEESELKLDAYIDTAAGHVDRKQG